VHRLINSCSLLISAALGRAVSNRCHSVFLASRNLREALQSDGRNRGREEMAPLFRFWIPRSSCRL
jgi:hypothetical protein